MNMIIVSGASGVGKSTLVKRFVDSGLGRYELAKSITTRAPRSEGEHYTFVSRETFQAMVEENAFLETNLYQGSKEFYGTPRTEIEHIIAAGKIPILEIDVNGKRQIERLANQYGFVPHSIFITAPPEMIYKRLIERGEPLENIVDRLTASFEEVAIADEYDSFIINYALESALKDMQDAVAGVYVGESPDVTRYRKKLMKLLKSIQKEVDEINE